jgi:hypothetical protein
LEKLSLSISPIPEPLPDTPLPKSEDLSLDLSNLLVDEGKALQALCKDLSEIPAEPFNVEEYINFSPVHQEQQQPPEVVAEAEHNFLENI